VSSYHRTHCEATAAGRYETSRELTEIIASKHVRTMGRTRRSTAERTGSGRPTVRRREHEVWGNARAGDETRRPAFFSRTRAAEEFCFHSRLRSTWELACPHDDSFGWFFLLWRERVPLAQRSDISFTKTVLDNGLRSSCTRTQGSDRRGERLVPRRLQERTVGKSVLPTSSNT